MNYIETIKKKFAEAKVAMEEHSGSSIHNETLAVATQSEATSGSANAPDAPESSTPMPAPMPVASVSAPQLEDIDEAAYLELSQRAGFDGAEVVMRRRAQERDRTAFRRFLSENGICVYDADTVWNYMNSITPNGFGWMWVSTRRVENGYWYVKPIPTPVLMTMAKIRERYPEARFDVTDIQRMPKGDPFLRVDIHGETLIIERWDEPGFRM